jgi:bacterioferritin-associated ferredoxin
MEAGRITGMNSKQIICTCNGVSAGQIEKAVKEGARTFEEVQNVLHIGVQCIKCRELASLLIESYVEDMES